MEAMAEFPDKYFDFAIVDPEYGININNNIGRRKGDKKSNYKKITWDKKPAGVDYFNELFRVSKNQIIWGGNYFELPPCKKPIVWDKCQPEGIDQAMFEYAWNSIDNAQARIFRFSSAANKNNVSTSRLSASGSDRIHPTQKPIALYKWLLKNYAKPGDKILDTHLGSGSSRIAAWDMGFDFWGYEIDADYFNDHEKRFKNHISKPVLFEPNQMYNFEQAKMF